MVFVLIICAVVIFSAIFTNKFLNALGIPALLFFLLFGMLLGIDGALPDFNMIKELCSIALGFIIFYGGFCTKWKTARPVIAPAAVLSTFGVLFTALLTAVFCHFVLRLQVLESFLIGSVIASTDAASVFSILRAKQLNLKESTGPLLEIESGSNDPMSYVLVVLAIALMQGNSGGFAVILFFKQIFFGIIIGMLVAKLAGFVFRKTNVVTDGNEPLFIIALVLIAYAFSEIWSGNQFLAVYFLGIILGNSDIPNKVSVMSFFDGITKLAQIGIFFTLGLLAFPDKVVDILYTGGLIFLFLTFVARPVAVTLLLTPFKASKKQIILTSWAGLRGVASIVFAIIAMNNGLKLDYDLFHLVFLISLLSLAFQGTLLPFAAAKTGMIDRRFDIKKTFNDYHEECAVKFFRAKVPAKHQWVGKKIRDITFPDNALVLLIKRNGERILPKNSTKILEGDVITLTLPVEGLEE